MARFNLAAVATALVILSSTSVAHLDQSRADNVPRQAAGPSSSIVTLHLINFDDQPIMASVITANPTATSYFLTCPTDEPGDECGLGPGIKVLEGPSTLEVHMSDRDFIDDTTCALTEDAADCFRSAQGGNDGRTQLNMHYDGISTWAMEVTVTAGLEALTSGESSTSSTTTGSTTTSSTATTSGSGNGSGSETVSPTRSPGTTPAVTGSGAAQASSTSMGRMPAVTGNAVVAGVAAILGGMLAA